METASPAPIADSSVPVSRQRKRVRPNDLYAARVRTAWREIWTELTRSRTADEIVALQNASGLRTVTLLKMITMGDTTLRIHSEYAVDSGLFQSVTFEVVEADTGLLSKILREAAKETIHDLAGMTHRTLPVLQALTGSADRLVRKYPGAASAGGDRYTLTVQAESVAGYIPVILQLDPGQTFRITPTADLPGGEIGPLSQERILPVWKAMVEETMVRFWTNLWWAQYSPVILVPPQPVTERERFWRGAGKVLSLGWIDSAEERFVRENERYFDKEERLRQQLEMALSSPVPKNGLSHAMDSGDDPEVREALVALPVEEVFFERIRSARSVATEPEEQRGLDYALQLVASQLHTLWTVVARHTGAFIPAERPEMARVEIGDAGDQARLEATTDFLRLSIRFRVDLLDRYDFDEKTETYLRESLRKARERLADFQGLIGGEKEGTPAAPAPATPAASGGTTPPASPGSSASARSIGPDELDLAYPADRWSRFADSVPPDQIALLRAEGIELDHAELLLSFIDFPRFLTRIRLQHGIPPGKTSSPPVAGGDPPDGP
ncbi:MAG: hypothetical protein HYS22_05400 [Deltaproteobacteria bacterium]|nr:hypothetical protein [Deltaproteobacteria bacterium]